jgi:8-oxo-dGTP diphosphatase
MPLPSYDERPRPALTTNVVIFSLRDGRLKVLLVRRRNPPFQGQWGLPGGFVDADEDLQANAIRMLKEGTGVTGVYLEQLFTFGELGRDPRERVVSVVYFALVPSELLRLRGGSNGEGIGWFDATGSAKLAFDHADMIKVARDRLAAKLDYSTIAFQFLPERFTLSDLQNVYQIILDCELDKRNFRKRMLALDQIEQTDEFRRNGNHRPARLYRINNPTEVQIIK